MARTRLPPHEIADLGLAPAGVSRIAWAGGQMPVLARVRARFEQDRPLEGVRLAACLHVTAETANLVLTLAAFAVACASASDPPPDGACQPFGTFP